MASPKKTQGNKTDRTVSLNSEFVTQADTQFE